jgi:uncharacterized membrane protein YfcA
MAMSIAWLIGLGTVSGLGAGLLAGLIGIGGGIVVVPVVYFGLLNSGIPQDEAVHVDFAFLRDWGPGIAIGVVAAQFAAPHVRGGFMTAIFAVMCLVFAVRFAFPQRFRAIAEQPPDGRFRHMAGAVIGITSGFAGIGGGILTNIVMTLSGLPMHKSIGRAAAAGIVVSIPATLAAALASKSHHAFEVGSIDLTMWACIAPAQAVAAWFGARLAPLVSAEHLSRIFAIALTVTGVTMLHSSLA